jgi:putrescine transport system ATP-binding protein
MKKDFAPWSDPGARPLLRFQGVSKSFGGVVAIDDLSLDIFEGEFFALLGPSGCGKTTLLRLLAGFETPDRGKILLGDTDIAPVPPYRRPVNMMFQNYALFPHLTVAGNIAFGLKQERHSRAEIRGRVDEMLALVNLEGFGARKPHQLSGGQRQRVALARSLAKRPKVLLLDEPMAALDKKLRERTQAELIDLQARVGTTFVIVTHDQDEAMTVATRIAVMNLGKLMQVGTPPEIYESPQSRWVAGFVGDINLIEGTLASVAPGKLVLEIAEGCRLEFARAQDVWPGQKVFLAVRPERIAISNDMTPRSGNSLRGQIADIQYRGRSLVYAVRTDAGLDLRVVIGNPAGAPRLELSEQVQLTWPADAGAILMH